jgi:anti-sigma factor RsiW
MSCNWRDKVALYVDDELDPGAQKEFSAHLGGCLECAAAVSEQFELKKALRAAGRSFNAPADLHAALYRAIHPSRSVSPWWKWALAPLSVLLLGIIGFLLIPKSHPNPMLAALVDAHITSLASEHPVDVISEDRHTVKPWFQGKLPFTFNLPDLGDGPFKLIGGKVVYAGQNPGAELVYTMGPHKVSVFIFAAPGSSEKLVSSRNRSFNISRWKEGDLEYYLVTDASSEEAGKLVAMFTDANRS